MNNDGLWRRSSITGKCHIPSLDGGKKKLTGAGNSRLAEVGSIVAVVHREEHSIAVVEEG